MKHSTHQLKIGNSKIVNFFMVLFVAFSVSPVLASPATPSAEVTTSVVDKIKTVVQKSATASAVEQTPILKGYVGIVNSLTNTSLNVTTTQDTTLQVATNPTTTIVSGSKKIPLSDIPLKSKVIIIGTNTSTADVLLASRLVLIPPTPTPTIKRDVLLCTVTETKTSNKSLKVTCQDNPTTTILTTTKTTPKFEDVKKNTKLFAIIKTDLTTNTSTLLKATTLP